MSKFLVLAVLVLSAVPALVYADGGDGEEPTCSPPTTLVVCPLPELDDSTGAVLYSAGVVSGYTKAEALAKANASYLAAELAAGNTFSCTSVAP